MVYEKYGRGLFVAMLEFCQIIHKYLHFWDDG